MGEQKSSLRDCIVRVGCMNPKNYLTSGETLDAAEEVFKKLCPEGLGFNGIAGCASKRKKHVLKCSFVVGYYQKDVKAKSISKDLMLELYNSKPMNTIIKKSQVPKKLYPILGPAVEVEYSIICKCHLTAKTEDHFLQLLMGFRQC